MSSMGCRNRPQARQIQFRKRARGRLGLDGGADKISRRMGDSNSHPPTDMKTHVIAEASVLLHLTTCFLGSLKPMGAGCPNSPHMRVHMAFLAELFASA